MSAGYVFLAWVVIVGLLVFAMRYDREEEDQ